MDGYAGFREPVDQVVGVWKVLGYHYKHFIDPFLADVHGNIAFLCHNRDAADLMVCAVVIDYSYSGNGVSGIVILLHAADHFGSFVFGGDDEKLLVTAVFHLFM